MQTILTQKPMSLSPPPLPIPPLGRYKARGVDEAQRRREEEEGESVGGRDRNGVPGAGGELGRGGRR